LLLVACLCAFGCQSGTLPDPNDPNDVSVVQPDVLRSSLKGASDALLERMAKGELDRSEFERYMAEYANKLLESTNIQAIPPERAWEYGEVFRTAKRWPEAEKVLRLAVKSAKNEDRRVNDTLRLAHVLAQEGQVAEAVKLARTTFDTPPQEKAPILTAVLLEIVPAGRGKGSDLELAKLLEDAIPQAEQTLVDNKTESGEAFIFARPHHIHNARRTVVELYEDAGRSDLAERAMQREEEASRRRNPI
jgi:predicted negative regulator of RcsB-dependent stress response